jgi:hypothetical protein
MDMHASVTYDAGMAKIQYTTRGVSERLDVLARKRARKDGKSLNETLLTALQKGLDIPEDHVRYSDLDDLAGTWVLDPEFDRAVEEMHRIDPGLWK